MLPIISVIIPSYNRENTLGRAIKSVLLQDYPRFEIIIIDDASTDHTYEIAKSYERQNIKIIRHKVNCGIGPTRNTGIHYSQGTWIFPLDSDDEMAEGFFDKAIPLLSNISNEIMRIRGMVLLDNGKTSPEPQLKEEIWDYEKYIRSLNVVSTNVETSSIYRREALLNNPYQTGRTIETLFHLDFFKSYKVLNTDSIFRYYHSDASNNTRGVPNINNLLRDAPDYVEMVNNILSRHGDALKAWAPNEYDSVINMGIKHNFLSGNKKRGIELSKMLLNGCSVRTFCYLSLGLIHPYLLAFVSCLPAILRKYFYRFSL